MCPSSQPLSLAGACHPNRSPLSWSTSLKSRLRWLGISVRFLRQFGRASNLPISSSCPLAAFSWSSFHPMRRSLRAHADQSSIGRFLHSRQRCRTCNPSVQSCIAGPCRSKVASACARFKIHGVTALVFADHLLLRRSQLHDERGATTGRACASRQTLIAEENEPPARSEGQQQPSSHHAAAIIISRTGSQRLAVCFPEGCIASVGQPYDATRTVFIPAFAVCAAGINSSSFFAAGCASCLPERVAFRFVFKISVMSVKRGAIV